VESIDKRQLAVYLCSPPEIERMLGMTQQASKIMHLTYVRKSPPAVTSILLST